MIALVAASALGGPGERILAETERIIEDLGGRPAGFEGGDRAQAWVAAELRAAGFPAVRVPGRTEADGYVIGCRRGRSPRTVLFLAHTDTVHARVVGASDNAAAMAVLLDVARELAAGPETPRAVCLAFPDGEELGLLGSERLSDEIVAHAPHPLDQVMALDLVGHGQLTHNGLGPAWSGPALSALLEAAPAEVPWMYRAISEARPEYERSDHHWFGRKGVPSSHLLGRGPSGVLWTYHTVDDTVDTLEPDALAAARAGVLGVARAEPLPPGRPTGPAVVVPFTGIVAPGGLVWLGTGLSLGLAGLGRWRRSGTASLRRAGWALGGLVGASTVGAAIGMGLASLGRGFGLALAGPVLLAGWAGLAAGASLRSVEGPRAVTFATVALGLLAGLLLATGFTLVALPVVVAMAATAWLDREWRVRLAVLPLALWPGLYLVRADPVRELAFHEMVSASEVTWTVLLAWLGLPLSLWVATLPDRARRRLGLGAAGVLVFALLWAWVTPEAAEPFVRRPLYVRPWLPPVDVP